MLIALSLTGALIGTLFSFLVESARIAKKIESARSAALSLGYVQTRLQTIFTSLDRSLSAPFFYTKKFDKEKKPSLIAIFNNGIDPDPAFSGSVVARIYLDESQNLCLATWPVAKSHNQPWRNEILLSGVKHLEFEFLGKKSATEHGVKDESKPITPTLCWRGDWGQSNREVPGIIRLTLDQQIPSEPIRFAFILPVWEPFTTYTEKKGGGV